MEELSLFECTVSDLLTAWNLEELIDDFIQKDIDMEVILNLNERDINNLIPIERFGLRIKFRTKLFNWKREKELYTPFDSTPPNAVPATLSVDRWLDATNREKGLCTPLASSDSASSDSLSLSNAVSARILGRNRLTLHNLRELSESKNRYI